MALILFCTYLPLLHSFLSIRNVKFMTIECHWIILGYIHTAGIKAKLCFFFLCEI